jgi:pimeloyl-ACP methyl ester carboxylesterase
LLQTWYSLSHFPLNRRKAVALLERYNVPTLVLLGQDDQIVPSSRVQPYVEELPSVLVHEEAGNHLSVLGKVAPYLQDGLLPYWQWLRMK